jgi:hypothetical protein
MAGQPDSVLAGGVAVRRRVPEEVGRCLDLLGRSTAPTVEDEPALDAWSRATDRAGWSPSGR